MKVTSEGLKVLEYHETTTPEALQAVTEAELIFDDDTVVWRD